MKGVLAQLTRVGAGVLSAALVGHFGIAVLIALGVLVVLGIVVVCWIVDSEARSVNLSRILCARRGNRYEIPDGAERPPSPRRSNCGCVTCRSKTATSCRSTRISTFFAASLRASRTSQQNTRTMNT
jgi:hypothetical protein